MRAAAIACVLAGVGLWVRATPAAAAQDAVFRAGSPYVPIYATVIGPDGRLVTGLDRGEFTVLDNGRPRAIDLFDNGPQAIHIVVMLDTSGSMMGNLPVLQAAADQFFSRIAAGDRVRVGHFGETVRLTDAFTDDAASLSRAVHREFTAGGGTPLWSAMDTAMTALAPLDGRRVVLVFSDGHDTGLWDRGHKIGPTAADVAARAARGEFMIYAIGMRSRGAPARPGLPVPRFPVDQPDPGLRALAENSGGGYFELTGTEDLGAVFARVADELRRQYLIGFSSADGDGAVHALEVRVRTPGVVVRARRSYIASTRRVGWPS